MPALLISTSILPKAAITCSAAWRHWPVGHVAGEAEMPGPSSSAAALAALGIEIEDGDPGAVLGEQPRGGEADAARAGRPGNHGSLVGQQHAFLPVSCSERSIIALRSPTNEKFPSDERLKFTYRPGAPWSAEQASTSDRR